MKVVKSLFFIFNLLLIAATLLAYIAPLVSPKGNGLIAICGLTIPGLLLGNFLMLFLSFLINPKWAIFSFLVLLLSIPFAPSIINISGQKTKHNNLNSLHTGTYNTQFSKCIAFLEGTAQKEMEKKFTDFLKKIDHLDILAVQEFGWRTKEIIEKSMNFPYQYFIPNIYNGIYSKHPIVNKGVIEFGQTIRKCLWADIAIGQDTIRYYSAHLEPNRHDGQVPVFENQEKAEHINYWFLFGVVLHYETFANKRAEQAAIIRAHQSKSPYPCIIAGDLNAPPQTFTYATISNGLKDTFVESGFGVGATHGTSVPGLRIDYLLVDSSFSVVQHKVHENKFSDHFLVEAFLQF